MDKTREEIIEDLINDVETWDIDDLIQEVQYYTALELREASDEILESEWNRAF